MSQLRWMEILDPAGVHGHPYLSKARFPVQASLALAATGRAKFCHPPTKPAPSAQKSAPPEPQPSAQLAGDGGADDPASTKDAALAAITVRKAIEDGRKPALEDALALVGIEDSSLTNNDKRAAALNAWLAEQEG